MSRCNGENAMANAREDAPAVDAAVLAAAGGEAREKDGIAMAASRARKDAGAAAHGAEGRALPAMRGTVRGLQGRGPILARHLREGPPPPGHVQGRAPFHVGTPIKVEGVERERVARVLGLHLSLPWMQRGWIFSRSTEKGSRGRTAPRGTRRSGCGRSPGRDNHPPCTVRPNAGSRAWESGAWKRARNRCKSVFRLRK